MPVAPAHVRHRLFVELRHRIDGPALDIEPVRADDLHDAVAELWFQGCLRRGHPGRPLADVTPRLRPVFRRKGSSLCRGFVLQLDEASDPPAAAAFGRELLHPVAARARRRLVAAGRLPADAIPYYDLRAEPLDDASTTAPPPTVAPATAGRAPIPRDRDGPFVAPGVRVLAPVAPAAVEYETRPLAPLLERAHAVDVDADDDRHVVIFRESALRRAEAFSRRGGDAQPPVESGAVLVGTLCACPDTGEMYCFVRDALEATDAHAAAFSLAFSGATWAAIGAVMNARRARPGAPPELIVGSAHGHNFLPDGGAPPCEACATAEVCDRTSAALSREDETWSRAVFHAQPWQLALVYGLSARGDRVASLYGQRGGVLRRRGHHVLPDDAAPDA